MPSKSPYVGLQVIGGWSTDAGPSAPALRADLMEPSFNVPWLIDAENIVFALDGWPVKMPGATAYNATLGASVYVTGITDFWRSTTSGYPIQRRVITAGTGIYQTANDGTFTALITTLESAKIPAFLVFRDLLIIATDSTVDVPQSWDGLAATTSDLAGSPPNFAFMVEYNDRVFAGGVDSNKSRLYYTALSTAVDWTGAGSGSIDISPDDGDQLTGLVTHKDQLWCLKGPNLGSLHYLSGSAPTGSDAFALNPFVRGIGCTSHNSIVKYADDVAFWDDNGIHSLAATAAYGNYNERFLSRDISSFVLANMNHARMNQIQGVNFSAGGYMLWTLPRAGSNTNNTIVGLDYRFNPLRLFSWPAYSAASLGLVKDSNILLPWVGTYTGLVLRCNRSARNLNGSAYTAKVTFPYLNFGSSAYEKTLGGMRVSFAPKGDYTFTLNYTRDTAAQQSVSFDQGGGDTLGPSSNQFTLGTSTLAGGIYSHSFSDNVEGDFRELQLQLTQGGANQDMEVHSLAVRIDAPRIAED